MIDEKQVAGSGPRFPGAGRLVHRAATVVETLVVLAVIAVVGGIAVSIASAVWSVVKSWK